VTEVFIVAFIVLLPGIPAYVIGKRRREVGRPWLAFIPLFGAWIVLLQSTKHSGWIALVAVLPIASLAFGIWMAFELPSSHRRSNGWAFAMMIPGVGLLGLWIYAFTLPRSPAQVVAVAA
jgi:hypothetical protein